MPNPNPPLRTSDKATLRAASLCADKTIERWWRGENVRGASAERLERAAAQTGISRPSLAEVSEP